MSDKQTPAIFLIGSIDELETLTMAPRHWEFTVDKDAPTEKRCKIRIRAIPADEVSELDKLMAGITPPMVKKGEKGKEIEVYDQIDAAYLAKRDEAFKRRQVAYIELGAPDMKIPGANLDEKVAYLFKKLPTGAIVDLYRAITKLTADPFSDALFSSTAS